MKITVAGQRLTIRTDAKPSYVKELAALVSSQIEEIRTAGRVQTTQMLALLAAMNIADELLKARESEARLKQQVKEKTERILHYLDAQPAGDGA